MNPKGTHLLGRSSYANSLKKRSSRQVKVVCLYKDWRKSKEVTCLYTEDKNKQGQQTMLTEKIYLLWHTKNTGSISKALKERNYT